MEWTMPDTHRLSAHSATKAFFHGFDIEMLNVEIWTLASQLREVESF
jgi:hypothetical protein